MTHPVQADRGRSDAGLLIAGAGVVGLALGIALARSGWPVTVLGPAGAPRNGRTVALLDGSVRMLAALGAWERVAGSAAALSTMRIVDDTGSLFGGPPVDFRSSEIGLPAFGFNVENAALVEALEGVAAQTPCLVRIDGHFSGFAADGERLRVATREGPAQHAALLIAADGADSAARVAAGIAVRETRYPQAALTTILRHAAPHGNVSTEFHTRQGPFTLVPMAASAEAPHRSSLVWVMTPAEADRRLSLDRPALEAEIDRQSRRLLGHVGIEGRIGRFPIRRSVAERLTAARIVLVGEAAHALPPIGAQGLNLSLRDAATLVDLLGPGGRVDPGSKALLDGYERTRKGDIALRAGGVDALNRSLLSGLLPVDLVRSGGLMALAALPSVRRAAMRFGLMPRHDVPRLML